MSERTRCNRCVFADLQRFAASTMQTAHLVVNAAHGGFDVLVLPLDQKPPSKGDGEQSDGWAAWFWEISERCAC